MDLGIDLRDLVILAAALAGLALIVALWAGSRGGSLLRREDRAPEVITEVLEKKHLAMLKDLNDGLNSLADRLGSSQGENTERLRTAVSQDLKQTRDALLVL